jgi:hypothetical protein
MTFEGSRGIIFQQIAYLFEKCKQCITKAIPFAGHNFGPFEHVFFVVVLFVVVNQKHYLQCYFEACSLSFIFSYFDISFCCDINEVSGIFFDRKCDLDLPKHCVFTS